METQVIKMTQSQINQLKKEYQNFDINYKVQYTQFQIKGPDFTITAYNSGKVVFQAQDLSKITSVKPTQIKEKQAIKIYDTFPMAGSDESGKGDYFGPLVVCAAIITEKDYPYVQELFVRDSKTLSENELNDIAPKLMKLLKYNLQVLDNESYNQLYEKYPNINILTAILHNKAFVALDKSYGLPETTVIDEFASAKNYFNYLKDEPVVFKNLIFEKKAEPKCLAVAAASIIATYTYKKEILKMRSHFNFDFPFNKNLIDLKAKEFVQEFGKKELSKVAKLHFTNTQRIISEH